MWSSTACGRTGRGGRGGGGKGEKGREGREGEGGINLVLVDETHAVYSCSAKGLIVNMSDHNKPKPVH